MPALTYLTVLGARKLLLAGGVGRRYVWGMRKEQLNIRLPTDEGPNPYDSKTKFEDLPANAWAFKWEWWITVIIGGIGIAITGWWKSNH